MDFESSLGKKKGAVMLLCRFVKTACILEDGRFLILHDI